MAVPTEVDPALTKPTEVSTYDFNGMSLRVVQIDGEPWFVSADALRAMGYPLKSHTTIRKKLNEDECCIKRIDSATRSVSLVSESGFYKLATRSDKAEAKPFQEWVTLDVLPSIRKDGGYIMDEKRNLPYSEAKRIGLSRFANSTQMSFAYIGYR